VPRFEVLRTASFRLALIYACLFSLSAVVLVIFVYYTTTQYMQRQFDGFIQSQENALLLLDPGEDAQAIARTVDMLTRPAVDPYAHYLVLDPDGNKLGGTLPGSAAIAGWAMQELNSQNLTGPLLVRTHGIRLAKGGLLVVGRSEKRLLTVQRLIRSSLHIDLLMTLLLAVLGGIALSSLALRRLAAIEKTLGRIMHGELSTRLAVAGRDEVAQLTLRINQLLDWLQKSATVLQQVTNDIAHDLRRPLSHLRQHLDEALQTSLPGECGEQVLTGAVARVDGILALSSALLRLAQIEAGARRAGFRDIDLEDLAREMYGIYQPVAEAEGQTLVLLPCSKARLRGDRELLTQLIANLIENAICHTVRGTAIYLETTSRPPSLRVIDTGRGIPAEERSKVLRRFYKLDGNQNTSGNGLGLSVVSAIIALHGAKITLSDTNKLLGGGGLHVEVSFPAPFT